jgi:hypothetical protein
MLIEKGARIGTWRIIQLPNNCKGPKALEGRAYSPMQLSGGQLPEIGGILIWTSTFYQTGLFLWQNANDNSFA